MSGVPLREGAADMLAHGRMARKLGQRSLRAEQRMAARGIEPGQDGDELAVLAGDDRVLQDRRGGGERGDPQPADVHPGSGGELEVLRQPSVERDALAGIGRIDEASRIARAIEALLVERRGGEVGPLPVAGGHVRAAHPDLVLASRRHQLDLDTRHRHADRAGARR